MAGGRGCVAATTTHHAQHGAGRTTPAGADHTPTTRTSHDHHARTTAHRRCLFALTLLLLAPLLLLGVHSFACSSGWAAGDAVRRRRGARGGAPRQGAAGRSEEKIAERAAKNNGRKQLLQEQDQVDEVGDGEDAARVAS